MNNINAIQFSEQCASAYRGKHNETSVLVVEMLVFKVSSQITCVWFV